MAGHSKWANIKHKKARTDASRGKVFTKFIREITVAARLGGPNEADNPRLRAIVYKALGANMTRDVVNRAILRGAGGDDDKKLDELIYEGYGVGGVAVKCAMALAEMVATWAPAAQWLTCLLSVAKSFSAPTPMRTACSKLL
jgi:transcriptional/translational regulatory protein YebC/TACO1